MGIVMMFVFISLYGGKFMDKMGYSSFLQGRFETTSCRGVLAMLRRTLPAGQSARCEGNALSVEMAYRPLMKGRALSKGVLCPLLYRELANSLKFLASEQTAPLDILERVEMVYFKLTHPRLMIYAATSGKHLVGISALTSPRSLAEHVRDTVKVQEFPPTCY